MRTIARCVFVVIAFLFVNSAVIASDNTLEIQVNTLLSRLNLDLPQLGKVKAVRHDPQRAAEQLLAYYRSRTSVVHTEVDRGKRHEIEGDIATPRDIEIADDAVRNILIATPNYPRYDFDNEIDWFTNQNPKGDLEWIVQLHRQYSWLHLGKAYWQTGDEKYAEAYCMQLAHWLDHCPRNDGWPAWRMLEVGIRGHSWTGHFNYFLDSPHYTPQLLIQYLNSLYEHADLLTADREYSKNNWGLMEAEGTAFIAICFPEFKEAAAWRSKSFAYLTDQIDKQVFDDGMHMEMCFDYHIGSIRWFDRTRQLAQANGYGDAFPEHFAKTIERMYEVVGRCAHPNRYCSMFGDDRPKYVTSTIRRGAEMFPHNQYLQFLATQGKEGKTPPTSFALPTAGIYSFRSGWDEQAIHFLMKCGQDGGWHCQPDNGTFELYAFGRYLMPDSGCYIYSGDKEGRQWFRQTKVHQTLTLNGQDSACDAKLLYWPDDEKVDFVLVQNTSYENLVHRRAVLFKNESFFVIVDEAIGDAAGDVDLHFQLAPGEMVFDTEALTARTDFETGGNVLVYALAQPNMTMYQAEGQVSLVYSEKQPRPAFYYRINKSADTLRLRFVTLVIPFQGEVPEVSLQQVEEGKIQISVNQSTATMVFDFSKYD